MYGQRHPHRAGRKRKRPKSNGPAKTDPIRIAARRPDAPSARPPRRLIAASASPASRGPRASNVVGTTPDSPANKKSSQGRAKDPASRRVNGEQQTHRVARIVRADNPGPSDREKERQQLVACLLASQGRVAISRAANDLRLAGYDFPLIQDVQLQLLEHQDESMARDAIVRLEILLRTERPIQLPVFSQRLRRLEDRAEDPEIRRAAAGLRRLIRA
jgi:hypothetical protein